MHCVDHGLIPSDIELLLPLKMVLWEKFRPILKNKWEGTFTSWLEYAMECYSRNTCEDCPYEPDDGQEKAVDGIGKIVDKET